MGTTSPDTGNTSHSSSSSPRLGAGLVSGIHIDAVGLTPVLSDLVVDGGHDVGPHRGAEHGGETDGGAGADVLVIVDGDQRTGRCQRHLSEITYRNQELHQFNP